MSNYEKCQFEIKKIMRLAKIEDNVRIEILTALRENWKKEFKKAMCDSAKRIKNFVAKQAEDESIWFLAETVTEEYLQRKIRELHEAIERELGIT